MSPKNPSTADQGLLLSETALSFPQKVANSPRGGVVLSVQILAWTLPLPLSSSVTLDRLLLNLSVSQWLHGKMGVMRVPTS